MTWLFTLLAMAVIALVAGVVTGRISGGMDAPESSLPFRGLPPDDVAAEDLDLLRFTPALRGYRMNQVDEVLDQLGQELRRRDDELARLRAVLAGEPDAAAGGEDDGADGPAVLAGGDLFARSSAPQECGGRDQDGRDQDGRDQDSRDQDSRDQDSRDQDERDADDRAASGAFAPPSESPRGRF